MASAFLWGLIKLFVIRLPPQSGDLNGCLTIFVENAYFQRIVIYIYLIMNVLGNLNIPKPSLTTKIVRQPYILTHSLKLIRISYYQNCVFYIIHLYLSTHKPYNQSFTTTLKVFSTILHLVSILQKRAYLTSIYKLAVRQQQKL